MNPDLATTLQEIGIPESASRVYSDVLTNGASTGRQIAERTGMTRPSVYDQLKLLASKGLVLERREDSKRLFQTGDVRELPQLIRSRIDELKRHERFITSLLPSLEHAAARSLEPRIRFYPGLEGVKQVLKDMLWHENIETLTLWPIGDMIEILGVEYLADLNRRRIRRNISIRGIWPRDQAVSLKEYPFLGVGEGFLRQLRLAPKGVSWKMSCWLYGDKAAFISSKREAFGFVLTSRDFVELLTAQFEVLWTKSRPITPQSRYTDPFLRTV